ncbi:MAG: ribosome silencing factor [Gammaproteobacteria bacterium]
MKNQMVNLEQLVLDALEDLKGQSLLSCDVQKLTSITDTMIFCTGTSNRHVKSLANHVVMKAKAAQYPPLSVEGEREGEWILIDLGHVVVHIMLPKVRTFYNLEKIWDPNFTANTTDQ